jgi:hypothetical protein
MRRFRAQHQKGTSRLSLAGSSGSLVCQKRAGSCQLAWLKSYLLARLDRLELERRLDRVCDVRFVREADRGAVERAVLLRRVERVVVREAVRRFVPVLRRAVDLRVLDPRAVDLRPDDRRVVLRDVLLRPVVLRAVVLPPVLLRPVLLCPDVLRALEDLRPEDLRLAAVLPVRSRRLVRARLRLFSDELS